MADAIDADILIIGAGSAGLSVAAGAAQLGKSVVLCERGEMGGDCLNYGCVPSKALLAAAKAAHAFRTASKFGLKDAEPEIDFAAVNDHVQDVIAQIEPHDSQARFEGLGVTVIRERARFTGPREAEAGGRTIRFRHALIATGSSPFVPPIDGIAETPHLTNESLFDLRSLPARLIIIGGGPIGLEMAQAHRRLGSEVVVLEAEKALGKDDSEFAAIVLDRLRAEGVDIREGARVEAVRKTEAGVEADVATGAARETVAGTDLLVAVGRRTNTDDLGLEAAGVETDGRRLKVDARLRTTNRRVYAAGDVAGGLQFTHVAGYHAGIVVRNMIFKTPSKNDESIAPWATYTDPELAQVGLTEAAARERLGDKVSVVSLGYDENDRGRAERATEGRAKAIIGKGGEILGATIVGKSGGDLIGLWAYAIANKQTVKSFTNYVAPYPTFGEISKGLGSAYYKPTLFSDRTRLLVRMLGAFD